MIRENGPGEVPRVVILGAGFAGIYTAINLSGKLREGEGRILLIDCNNYHLFKPLIHEAATGAVEPNSIIQPIRKIMEGRRFTFLEGMVQAIDAGNRRVVLCRDCRDCSRLDQCEVRDFGLTPGDLGPVKGQEVPYDRLVIALGGQPNYFGVPGAREHSYPLADLDDAVAVRKRITSAFRVASRVGSKEARRPILTFAVVGAGPTGIEFASSLHGWIYKTAVADFPAVAAEDISIYLIEAGGDILPQSDEETRDRARRLLAGMRIEVLTGSPVTRVEKDSVTVEGRGRIGTYTTVWAAGVRGHPAVAEAGLKTDGLGRVVINEYLEAEGAEGVYALGDCASLTPRGLTSPLPQTGQVAVQEAKHLVKIITADLGGGQRRPFRFRELGSSFSMGEYTGLANLLGVLRLGGFLGWLVWKFTYLKHLWGIKRGPRGVLEWFTDITYDREASRHKFSK